MDVTAATAPVNQSYSLTTGKVTLNSNVTFNVANNGTGTGTLYLGNVDPIVSFGVTVGGPGTVVYTAGGNYGGATNVNGGTLQVNGTVSGTGAVTVASAATLSGPVSTGGSGSMAGAVTVQSNGTIAATNGAAFSLTGGLTLPAGSLSSFNLAGTPNGVNTSVGLVATSGASPTSLNLTGANTISFSGVPAPGILNRVVRSIQLHGHGAHQLGTVERHHVGLYERDGHVLGQRFAAGFAVLLHAG